MFLKTTRMIEILLATYNGGKYLKDQIESILDQTYQDFRILIRDDASTDNTALIIDEYKNKYPDKIVTIIDSLGNIGCRKSFMELLRCSSHDYIMFCDQDDIWLPNKIELTYLRMKELEKETNSPILVFTDLIVVDSELNVLNNSFWNYQKITPNIATDWKKLVSQNVITGCTMMINREAKKIVLPFELDMMIHDQWIGVNVAKKGKVGYINQPTMLYRQHGGNVAGAISFNGKYLRTKVKDLLKIFFYFRKATSHFNEISLAEIIGNKLTINFKRLYK